MIPEKVKSPIKAKRTAEPLIAAENLSLGYERQPALTGVTFAIMPGEQVAVIGPNGAGKSTLIKAIMWLLPPLAGTLRLNLDSPYGLGYVPQHEGVDWDFPVTAREVVMMGQTRKVGWLRRASAAQWKAVDAALARVGMSDFGRRQIGELSGGQRRRVFIARALAQEAQALVLDEPFSGVDASAQAGLMDVLESLNREGMTILLSTHDLGLAFSRFDRVLALHQTMIAYGPPNAVYRPEVLASLYGGQLATWQNGKETVLFVDDHHCHDEEKHA